MAHKTPLIIWLTLCLYVACWASTLQAYDYKGYKHPTGGKHNGYVPHKSYGGKKSGGKVMNLIDSCWRSDRNWASNRKALADCVVGFGNGAIGGKNGKIYVVTDPSDDATNPKPGTLRYGVTRSEPLWIIFKHDMSLRLENELLVNSFKTIDGRGANVVISNGPCITIPSVSHVIIHGISVHDCKPSKPGMVMSNPYHVGEREGSDGDSISVFSSTDIWIDHCYLARATDGLLDVTHSSTRVTISNNYFTQHDKVMLLGHRDGYTEDEGLKVTVVFNYFGPKLVQRMPRVRYGYAHVANNRYDEWIMYAIGGSSDPTILSEGNYFVASNDPTAKQVTKRETDEKWAGWKWKSSSKDVFINGAYFVPSGYGSCDPPYNKGQGFNVAQGSMVPLLTSDAGPLQCRPYQAC